MEIMIVFVIHYKYMFKLGLYHNTWRGVCGGVGGRGGIISGPNEDKYTSLPVPLNTLKPVKFGTKIKYMMFQFKHFRSKTAHLKSTFYKSKIRQSEITLYLLFFLLVSISLIHSTIILYIHVVTGHKVFPSKSQSLPFIFINQNLRQVQ